MKAFLSPFSFFLSKKKVGIVMEEENHAVMKRLSADPQIVHDMISSSMIASAITIPIAGLGFIPFLEAVESEWHLMMPSLRLIRSLRTASSKKRKMKHNQGLLFPFV